MEDTDGSAKPVPQRTSAFTKSESTYADCVRFSKRTYAVYVWWNLFLVKEVCALCVWTGPKKEINFFTSLYKCTRSPSANS
jgi:hypothetical protein